MSSPLRKFKPSIQDFLATVLVFKLHIFSRDSLVAFDYYQSKKIRTARIVNRVTRCPVFHRPSRYFIANLVEAGILKISA